jgi:hypothetical protein
MDYNDECTSCHPDIQRRGAITSQPVQGGLHHRY